MNEAIVDKVVQAVLYEGYNLYPYRPSVKNRCRWTFGGLFPRSYSQAMEGTDAWNMRVQCLVEGQPEAAVRVRMKFLHLIQRSIGALVTPCDELPEGTDPAYQIIDSIEINGTRYQAWQEAVEREATIGPELLASLSSRPRIERFAAPAVHALEPIRGPDGRVTAVIIRDQEAIEGSVEISAERVEETVYRLTVGVFNRTALENAGHCSRDEALLRALVATHAVLVVRDGRFHSLTDPPEQLRDATAACKNIGVWPVLVGDKHEHDALLASPIILYDYPEIAPESPGDLFDGTEIDEILTLRIATLTDEEKALAAATDDRTRRLLAQTESLAREQLAGLHGAMRPLEPVAEANVAFRSAKERDVRGAIGDHAKDIDFSVRDPFDQRPAIESVRVDDVELRLGDRVRLRPAIGGDILDLALAGKTAVIESIEQDFEDRYHVAVTVDDDPGRDLGLARQPGHRFFFRPEELGVLDASGAEP